MNKSNCIKINNITLASIILLTLIACNDITVEEHLTKAKSYLDNNETSPAVIELKNAIQQDPGLSEPRQLLGQIYLQNGQFASAEKEFSRATRNGANREVIEPLLARALLSQEKNEAVSKLVDKSTVTHPKVKSELLALKSLALLKQGSLEEAKYTLELAENAGQDSLYHSLSKASIAATEGNLDLALSTTDQLIVAFQESSDAWLLKGHLETSKGHYLLAAESYQKAIELTPNAIHYTLFLAQALLKNEQYDKAEEQVDKLLQASFNNVLINEIKATVRYVSKDFDTAKEYADRAIQYGSNNITTYIISGVVAFKQNKIEQANTHLKKVSSFVPDDHFINQIYVATQLRLGNIEGAIETLNTLPSSSEKNSKFISDISLEFAKIGRNDIALNLAEKAAQFDSSDSNSKLRLGLIKLANNDTSGLGALEQVLKIEPTLLEANVGMIYFHLKRGELEEANKAVDSWLASQPEDINAMHLKGMTKQLQKDYGSAKTWYNRVLDKDPENIPALLALAHLKSLDNQINDAFKDVIVIAAKHPDNQSVAKQLFSYAKRTNQFDQAISLYKNHIKENPAALQSKTILAQGYAVNGNYTQAINLLNDLSHEDKNATVWRLLTLLYKNTNNYAKSLAAVEKWLEMDELNLNAYSQAIHLHELNTRYRKGISIAEKAESLFPKQSRFALMKAGLLIKQNKLTESQQVLDSQDKTVKSLPVFLKLQAIIYTKQGELAKAVAMQEQRYKKLQRLSTAQDLAAAYVTNNQPDKAIAFIKQVISEQGTAAQPLELTLAQLQQQHRSEDAISQYQAILKREPNNVIALNNITWLYLEKNDYLNACQSASKAYKLAGNHAGIQDTYGYCLLKAGQSQRSLEPLRLAYQSLSNNDEVALHYAESLIANQKDTIAREVLSALNPSNSEHISIKNKLEKQLFKDNE